MAEVYIAQYDHYCKQHQKPVYAPIPRHQCNTTCRLHHLQLLPDKTNVFICEYARTLHYCNHACIYAQITPHDESIVCALTGWVLPITVEKNYASISNDSGNGVTYTNTSSIVMGKKAKSRPRSAMRAPTTLVMPIQDVKDALYIFFGLRKPSLSTRPLKIAFPITFTDLQRQLFQTATMPPVAVTPIQIQLLAAAIVQFYTQLDLRWTLSVKTILTFTAVIVSKLRIGYCINKIEIFPRVEWITQHAPHDIAFSGVMNLQCRAMSTMWRKLQQTIICPQSGIPAQDKLFRLALS
jgi:hypothetical protein